MWIFKSALHQHIILLIFCIVYFPMGCIAGPYDPSDKKLTSVLPTDGMFEAFYPRKINGIPNGPARAPHAHGSFFAHRHPSLIDTRNSAAYGYRFDGARRFNFD